MWPQADGGGQGTTGADRSAPGLWGHRLQPSRPQLGAGQASARHAPRWQLALAWQQVRWEPRAGARAGNRGRGSSESGTKTSEGSDT